jgi:hypothetical protein
VPVLVHHFKVQDLKSTTKGKLTQNLAGSLSEIDAQDAADIFKSISTNKNMFIW